MNQWQVLWGAGVASVIVLAAPPVRADTIQITGIELKPNNNGLELILVPNGKPPQVLKTRASNTLTFYILNAQLRLSDGQDVRFNKPVAGIESISVTQANANSIRLAVIGTNALPQAEVIPATSQLVFSLSPAPATTEASEDKPEIGILVTGEREEEGYRVEEPSTATKLPLPQRDIPQSIQVIPRQVIEDRQTVRLNELTDNVSGVQRVPGYGGLSSLGVRIRGFTTQFETLRNGFRDFGYLSPRDIANVERVEVLKGPGSVLYGGGVNNFSGQINTVTKKPLEEPLYQINMTSGSYDFYRPTLDFTGPLTGDRSLLYRLNLAYETGDSFRNFNENESFFVAPALTWKIGERTNRFYRFSYANVQNKHFLRM